MAAPFLSAFAEQAQLQSEFKEPAGAQQMDQPAAKKGELKTVKYREEEAIYIQASNDRVTIIFSTVFKEETDREYGRLFLQVGVGLRVCCIASGVLLASFRIITAPEIKYVEPLRSWISLTAGICRRSKVTELAKCPSGDVLESRTTIGDSRCPRAQEWCRLGIRHF